jgi:hypothetical protein
MSKDSINIFVKGNKGKYAYEIKDKEGNQLYISFKENVVDSYGNHLWPNNTDFEAIISSLKFIKSSRGKNYIPQDPAISIYTTFENNYQVANEIKDAKKPNIKEYLEKIKFYQKDLRKYGAKDQTVKIFFAPNDFTHHFDNVNDLLNGTPLNIRT